MKNSHIRKTNEHTANPLIIPIIRFNTATKRLSANPPVFSDVVLPSSLKDIPSSSLFSEFNGEFLSVGASTSANDIISTNKHVLGWAVWPELLAKEACSLRTCAINDTFWFCSVLIRFIRWAFSSVHRLTLKNNTIRGRKYRYFRIQDAYRSSKPSTYSFLRRRESWADILLRIFLRIRFNSRSSILVKG